MSGREIFQTLEPDTQGAWINHPPAALLHALTDHLAKPVRITCVILGDHFARILSAGVGFQAVAKIGVDAMADLLAALIVEDVNDPEVGFKHMRGVGSTDDPRVVGRLREEVRAHHMLEKPIFNHQPQRHVNTPEHRAARAVELPCQLRRRALRDLPDR